MAKKATRSKKPRAATVGDLIKKDKARVFDYLRLASVRLVDVHAKLDIRNGKPLPSNNNLGTSLTIGSVAEQPNLLVDGFVDLTAKTESSEESSLVIHVHLQCVYAIEGAKAEELKDGGQVVASTGMLVMWPHFREIIQSLTSRMGLRPLTLPMFIAQATKGKSANLVSFDDTSDGK